MRATCCSTWCPGLHPAASMKPHEHSGIRCGSDPSLRLFRSALHVVSHRRAVHHGLRPLAITSPPAEESNLHSAGAPLSLYVHVPFCASPCFYCGCNRVITRSHERAESICSVCIGRSRCRRSCFPARAPVEQLHFGGGTPTFLAMSRAWRSDGASRGQYFTLGDATQREFSIEIDPRTVTPETR